jgi:hypothetical protein
LDQPWNVEGNYISPMQFEQDWFDATVKIAA